MSKIIVLGAGLSGLASSYHLGHNHCLIFEKNTYAGGHIFSEYFNGFTWDEGPHVSFTENDYVKEIFAESVNNEYAEYKVETVNYNKGKWVPHPAQSNLFAVSEPLRTECLNDFLSSRSNGKNILPANYDEWLRIAFGNKFADEFSVKYTRKYWTTEPKNMTTNWVGDRVFYPSIEDVINGYKAPLEIQTHYIKKVRYPKKGGYISFARKFTEGANISYKKKLESIDLKDRKLFFEDGTSQNYIKLISTIPLDQFVLKSNLDENPKEAARNLNCSSVLLVNVIANHPTVRKENWIYVYDEDKYSTRINCTELLSPYNGVEGKTGIQVEVYFSKYKIKEELDEVIAKKVIIELVEMGLIKNVDDVDSYFVRWVPYANVIFDIDYKENLDRIFAALEEYGLVREDDDLEPVTDWDNKLNYPQKLGDIILAGRFGQWKYYWTDDCVLRGKRISECINLH